MTELLKAIQAKFDANATLRGLFPNGCFTTIAFREEPLPVCVLRIASNRPQYNTGRAIVNNYSVRFTVFAEDGDLATQALDALKAAFNEQAISAATGTVLRSTLTNEDIDVNDENVFQGELFFDLWFQETI